MDPVSVASVFDPAGEKVAFREDLWPRFVYGAIAVFLLDLLMRRVRLFDRKFVPRRAAGGRNARRSAGARA